MKYVAANCHIYCYIRIIQMCTIFDHVLFHDIHMPSTDSISILYIKVLIIVLIMHIHKHTVNNNNMNIVSKETTTTKTHPHISHHC